MRVTPISCPSSGDRMIMGEKNIGLVDKNTRMVLGLVLIIGLILGLVGSPWAYLLLLFGIFLLVTGSIGICPLYSVMGINTVEKRNMDRYYL